MQKLFIVFGLLLLSNLVNGQQIISYHDANFIYKLTVDSVLSGDSVNYDCPVKYIAVIKRSDNKLVQVILVPKDDDPYCGLPKDMICIIGDVNFDGKNDIRVIQFNPAEDNIPYYYWIYNNKTHQFQRDTSLEDITSPYFDYKKKLIFSDWTDGCCDGGSSTYKYINGVPTLIEESEVEDNPNDSTSVLTIKKLIHGKMVVVKKDSD